MQFLMFYQFSTTKKPKFDRQLQIFKLKLCAKTPQSHLFLDRACIFSDPRNTNLGYFDNFGYFLIKFYNFCI
jgi:hypothetical protein